MRELIQAMLWSVSPFGEAKVGIPFALLNGVDIYLTLILCFLANVLVFPLMIYFLRFVNNRLFKIRLYKKSAIYVAKRTKRGAGAHISKYGFWGLLFFVMLPIPGTGVYAGTIATYMFRIPIKRAFTANVLGIFISCAIVWSGTLMAVGKDFF